MKTKAEIVKSLLEEKKIDIDEAMVLLMGEEKTVTYIPYPYNPQPYYPLNPYYPVTPIYYNGQSFPTICDASPTSQEPFWRNGTMN